jgi:hypothetical protein
MAATRWDGLTTWGNIADDSTHPTKVNERDAIGTVHILAPMMIGATGCVDLSGHYDHVVEDIHDLSGRAKHPVAAAPDYANSLTVAPMGFQSLTKRNSSDGCHLPRPVYSDG